MSDIEEVKAPIVVTPYQGTKDASLALLRYVVVIITAFPALMAVLKTHDIQQIFDFFHGDTGKGLIAAAVAAATAAYGIYRTWKRGAQAATVAAHPDVPAQVSHLK